MAEKLIRLMLDLSGSVAYTITPPFVGGVVSLWVVWQTLDRAV